MQKSSHTVRQLTMYFLNECTTTEIPAGGQLQLVISSSEHRYVIDPFIPVLVLSLSPEYFLDNIYR